MSDLKRLINREIKSAAIRERLRGKVVSDPVQKNFDVAGAQFFTWVVDVDVGGDQLLRDVPVKINGPKARFYARLHSPVFLERDAQGRYQVISPADRVQQQGTLIELDEDTDIFAAPVPKGFTTVTQPFEFYEGTGIPGGSLWNDGVHGFPEVTKLDDQGNEV